MKFQYFTTFLFIASSVYFVQGHYYWQDYFGDVPSDAIIAGTNSDGSNAYIGQAYVKSCGIVAVQITNGVKEVYATIGGLHKIDKYIKVLCGDQEDFYWMKTNSSNLHLQGFDKTAVIGGHEDTYGYMNIGRIKYSGTTKVGKINSFWPGNALFFFNNDGKEAQTESYEILMYNRTDVDIRLE